MPDASATTQPRGGRRTLLLVALVALAPVVLSTLVYVFFPRPATSNYGTLLEVGPAPETTGTTVQGGAFRLSDLRGKWLLVMVSGGGCDPRCRGELYATRQARTIQGREQDRIARVWLITDTSSPPPEVLAAHPGLVAARVDGALIARWPAGARAIYVVDPHGNLVLQYPEEPDIKRLAKDLKRLLTASSIG